MNIMFRRIWVKMLICSLLLLWQDRSKLINMTGWTNRSQKKRARKGPRRLLNQRRRHRILIKKLLKKQNQSLSNHRSKGMHLFLLRRKRSHNKKVMKQNLREVNRKELILKAMVMRISLRLKVKEKILMLPNQAQIHKPKLARPKKRHNQLHKRRKKKRRYSTSLLILSRECLKQLMKESRWEI